MADREMTNEEAIEILSGIRAYYNIFYEYDEPMYAALSKAISALKAEHVKHAKLMNPNPFGECSLCGYLIDIRQEYTYCPNCGAKMDEVKE